MIRVTLRGLTARWWRAMLVGLAAVVGVAVVSGTLMVSDTADRLRASDPGLDIVRLVMLIAGGVALLVGAFIVNITMSVTVAQRTRELALLRCLGASRRQVRRSVRLEALVIGAVAALCGLVLGFGVAAALRALINTERFPGDLTGGTIAVTVRTVAAAILIGCVVTVLSALTPARRAARVPPIAALRDLPEPDSRAGAVRLVIGILAVLAMVGLAGAGIVTGAGALLLVSAALALVAARVLGPWGAPQLAWLIGRPVAAMMRLPGQLGRLNAQRSPERTAATASALMIGIALLGLVTILLGSTRSAIFTEYRRYLADFRVEASDRGLDAQAMARLETAPEFAAAVPEHCTDGAVAGTGVVCAIDPALLTRVFALEVVGGRWADLVEGTAAVEGGDAAAQGWVVGSRVPVSLPGGAREFTVAVIYDSFYLIQALLIVPADYAALGGEPAPRRVYLRLADGVTQEAGRAAATNAVARDPAVEIRDRTFLRQQAVDQIDAVAWVYRSLTGLAALIGLAGIVNVLALSVVERRRELGLLRAVGMDRRGIRTMIRAEALITIAVGAIAGVGLGIFFGWAAVKVLSNGAQPVEFTVPVGTLAVIVALAALAGLAATALPARSAGRVNVVQAVTSE